MPVANPCDHAVADLCDVGEVGRVDAGAVVVGAANVEVADGDALMPGVAVHVCRGRADDDALLPARRLQKLSATWSAGRGVCRVGAVVLRPVGFPLAPQRHPIAVDDDGTRQVVSSGAEQDRAAGGQAVDRGIDRNVIVGAGADDIGSRLGGRRTVGRRDDDRSTAAHHLGSRYLDGLTVLQGGNDFGAAQGGGCVGVGYSEIGHRPSLGSMMFLRAKHEGRRRAGENPAGKNKRGVPAHG